MLFRLLKIKTRNKRILNLRTIHALVDKVGINRIIIIVIIIIVIIILIIITMIIMIIMIAFSDII